MKMIGEKIDYNNELLANTRSLRFKGSGLKSVCNKNTPSAGRKSNQNPKEDSIVKLKSKTLTVTPPQPSKKNEEPNQFVITLFEKCFRPSTETFRSNSQESEEIDSKVILMINKKKPEDCNSKNRPKSEGIKIGAKAQRYRQNNKSEPKKVHDFNNLSEKNLEQSQIKQLTPNERQNMKKTLLKSSPKIYMTKKNSPQFIELSSKLKIFEEDMKKTKKPTVLTLDLDPSNVFASESKMYKNYVSLKNHQLQRKSQPISSQNIQLPPQSQQQQHKNHQELYNDDKETVCIISRNKVFGNSSFHGLKSTKKIVNHTIQNQQIINIDNIQQQLHQDNKASRKLSVDNKINDNSNDYLLLPKQQIKYVLNRFNKEPISQQKQQTGVSLTTKPIANTSSIQHLNDDRNLNLNNKQVEQLVWREMESVNFDFKQSQTLRNTDCGIRLEPQHNIIDSPVSQRRKSLSNNNLKQAKQAIGYQSKLRCLDQGAKTIVTKYDSSDKRSIVQESIILFHGSKDLKPSYSRQPEDFKNLFNRQLLNNDYTTRYWGSLGVDNYINQSYEQEIQGNTKNSPYQNQSNETSFDKILVSPNPSIYKFKKAYSIRQTDNYL